MEYTNLILKSAPSYGEAAIAGLRKLRDDLARSTPSDPALARLDAYLDALSRNGPALPR